MSDWSTHCRCDETDFICPFCRDKELRMEIKHGLTAANLIVLFAMKGKYGICLWCQNLATTIEIESEYVCWECINKLG